MTLPELTLPQMLRQRASSDAARVAIRQKDFGIWKPCTWAAYYARACHFGLGLRQLGLPEGGHVGVLSENRIEWVLAQLGTGLVGGVTVGVYPTSPAAEVAYVVGHADVEIMVCEGTSSTDSIMDRRKPMRSMKGMIRFRPGSRVLV